MKHELGRLLVDLLPKRKLDSVRPALIWALGRLGSREPVYGPLNTVVAVEMARQWLLALLDEPLRDAAATPLALTLLARKTGDRYRDLAAADRRRVGEWLTAHDAPAHYRQLVEEGGRLDAEEQGRVFGESLPVGLRIV
jgi:hypothetical protein